MAIGDEHSRPILPLELSCTLSLLCRGNLFQPQAAGVSAPLADTPAVSLVSVVTKRVVHDKLLVTNPTLTPPTLAVEILVAACLLRGQRAIWCLSDRSCVVGSTLTAWYTGCGRRPHRVVSRYAHGRREIADAELTAARGIACGP